MVGYALQSLAESMGLTPWHDRGKGKEHDKEHLDILAEIHQIAGDPGDRARLLRKRLSVKKYMCGNGALALGIAGVVLWSLAIERTSFPLHIRCSVKTFNSCARFGSEKNTPETNALGTCGNRDWQFSTNSRRFGLH